MDLKERFQISNILQLLSSDVNKVVFDFRNGDKHIYDVYKTVSGMKLFIERMVKNNHIPELEKNDEGQKDDISIKEN